MRTHLSNPFLFHAHWRKCKNQQIGSFESATNINMKIIYSLIANVCVRVRVSVTNILICRYSRSKPTSERINYNKPINWFYEMLIPKWNSFYVIECLESMCASIGWMDIRYELLLLMVLVKTKTKINVCIWVSAKRNELYGKHIHIEPNLSGYFGYCYLVNFCTLHHI